MAAAPSGITISLPGIDPHDMERRRLSTITEDVKKKLKFCEIATVIMLCLFTELSNFKELLL
jgi:hypothetical protein